MNVLSHIFFEPWGREMHSAKRRLFARDLQGAFLQDILSNHEELSNNF